MRSVPRLLSIAFILLLIVVFFLWWNRPRNVDMTVYAPADSLIYLESNSLLNLARDLAGTEAWSSLSPFTPVNRYIWQSRWLQDFCAWTGIGPTQTVILTRAQVAMVIIDVGTTEAGKTLKIKPEAAILVETHTAEWRVRRAIEPLLKQFADRAYGQPSVRRTVTDGGEVVEWVSPAGNREIVATVHGSLLIIGNSERVVKECLAVRLNQRPSLREDTELQRMRSTLEANTALAFGYVSAKNAARLVSIGAPLLLGKAPGDLQFERLIASGAAKILGSIGWSSRPSNGSIEDRYLFSLQADVVARLKPLFKPVQASAQVLRVVPHDFNSLTIYQYEDSATAWKGFETALVSHLDTLSAVFFTSIVRSALLPYGIEEPVDFLHAVGPDLLTMRLEQNSERSILVAGVSNKQALQKIVARGIGEKFRQERIGEIVVTEALEKPIAASFLNGYVIMGPPTEVRRCAQIWSAGDSTSPEEFKRVSRFAPWPNPANIVTYANDHERVRTFLSAVTQAQGLYPPAGTTPELEKALAQLPYTATETTLIDQGLLRTTRSAFGLFSTLIPLLIPDQLGRR
jgi:hypothetical protein